MMAGQPRSRVGVRDAHPVCAALFKTPFTEGCATAPRYQPPLPRLAAAIALPMMFRGKRRRFDAMKGKMPRERAKSDA